MSCADATSGSREWQSSVTSAGARARRAYARRVGRVLRTELPDGYFHVYSRGAGPIVIFRDDDDFRLFRRMLLAAARRSGWRPERLGAYVPDNPVRAELCETSADWPWSWRSWEVDPTLAP